MSKPWLLATLLLAGCATHAVKPSAKPVAAAPAAAEAEAASASTPATDGLSNTRNLLIWQASGKMAIRLIRPDGKEQAGTAYFVWQQRGNIYRITLTGPLGQGRTVIEGTPEKTTLESPRTGLIEAATPEELMQTALGWSAPVSYMDKWLTGQAATEDAEVTPNPAGLVQSSLEGDWQADFTNYLPLNAFMLPRKIVITGPNTRLTVLVSKWQVE